MCPSLSSTCLVREDKPGREAGPSRYVTSFVFSADRCAHVPQYAFEDFAIRQIAQVLGKTDDEALFSNRSLVHDLGVAMFTVN